MNKNIKTNTAHNYNNTKKIKNWSEYNKSLKNRGNLSIFISDNLINDGQIVSPRKIGKVGRPLEYTDELIEFMLVIRELFRLPLRQTTGHVEFLFSLMGIKSKVPDYTTLSNRMSGIKARYYNKTRRCIDSGEGIVMLIDSSGFKVFGEGEWKVRKHGASYRRTWRETHLSVDYNSRDIVGLINTTAHVHDNTQLEPLINVTMQNGYKINTIIGDGAYDAKENYLLGRRLGIEMIAPPPVNAVEHLNTGWHHQWYDTPGWEERNAIVRHIEEWGIDGWKADVDYHRRSLVENAFYRLKTIFGDKLKARKEENQYIEQCLKAKIINRFNELGLPKYDVAS